MNNFLPLQAIPESAKTEAWARSQVDHVIAKSRFGSGGGNASEVTRLYDFYSGDIDPNEYKYVTDPYGSGGKKGQARLRSWPIIKNVIDVLVGEKAKRALNHSVVVINSDVVTRKAEQKLAILRKAAAEIMTAEAAAPANGMPGLPEAQELDPQPQDMAKVAELFEMSYRDARAVMGQKALNYIRFYNKIQDNFNKAFKDFLIAGYCVSYRNVVSDEPYYKILNPAFCDWAKDPDEDLLENADWFVYRSYMHLSGILRRYHKMLTPQQITQLESKARRLNSSYPGVSPGTLSEVSGSHSTGTAHPESGLFEVYWVAWQSVRKIGLVQRVNEDGAPFTDVVDEDYVSAEGEMVEWHMVNEVWEGHKIGDDVYVGVEPLIVQRNSLDNLSMAKLPFNGIVYSERNTARVSLVSVGIPFQLMYDIYSYRLERAVAKSKDIIAQFDIAMIPSGWAMEKFLYYVDEMGIAWSKTEDGSPPNPHLRQFLDLSVKTIEQYLALLASIRASWEQLAGVSRQRQGEVGQYEGKGVMQQAIMQSSHVTEEYFSRFGIFERADLQALLDYSKVAWINGKKAAYVMPDGTSDILELDPVSYMEAELGLFVTDARKENDKLEMARQLAVSFAQNGASMTTVLEMLDHENFAEIKAKVAEVERAQAQQAEAAQQMEQQMQQMAVELQAEQTAQRARELDIREMEVIENNQTKLEMARMGADDFNEVERVRAQERVDRAKLELEKRKLEETIRHNRVQEEIDRIKAKKTSTSSPASRRK